jgi:hypothetical protein
MINLNANEPYFTYFADAKVGRSGKLSLEQLVADVAYKTRKENK